ncbi:MAG: glycosyltransferase family 2 protein [Deltaproteobacteria bacterium]
MIFGRRRKIAGRVSILVPTMFDSRWTVELCLRSIWKHTQYPDYEIIICDAGVDQETRIWLEGVAAQDKIRLIKATDWQRPKDDLAAAVTSEYYCLMHDDTQILRSGWLTRRLSLMNRREDNAIVGAVTANYNGTKRFFPLGLLVKTRVARELGLMWGKQQDRGLDTGALAYQAFFAQKRYRFVPYRVSRDIRHFAEMTWPKYHTQADYPGLDKKLAERQRKIETIKNILATHRY